MYEDFYNILEKYIIQCDYIQEDLWDKCEECSDYLEPMMECGGKQVCYNCFDTKVYESISSAKSVIDEFRNKYQNDRDYPGLLDRLDELDGTFELVNRHLWDALQEEY